VPLCLRSTSRRIGGDRRNNYVAEGSGELAPAVLAADQPVKLQEAR
jgi:hypothetical protein